MSEQTFIQRKKVTNKQNINAKKQTKLQQAISFLGKSAVFLIPYNRNVIEMGWCGKKGGS